MDSDSRKFNKMSSSEDFYKIVKKALYEHSPIISWVKADDKRLVKNCRVDSISKPKQELVINIPEAGPNFRKNLEEQSILNFFISTNYSLFKLELEKVAGSEFCFKFPKSFIRLERRKNLRLQKDKRNRPQVSLMKFDSEKKVHKPIQGACEDYSTGGASFCVSKIDVRLFKQNEMIREIEIEDGGLKFVVNGRVIYKKEMDATDSYTATNPWRIGIEFLDINPKQEVQINRHILENVNLDNIGKAPSLS